MRSLFGAVLVAVFVGFVVQAAAANQCPASQLGACARLHLALMRSPSVTPVLLVAEPMRAATEHG
jgi:hypothetical protein